MFEFHHPVETQLGCQSSPLRGLAYAREPSEMNKSNSFYPLEWIFMK